MSIEVKEATFIRLDLFPAQVIDATDLENPFLVSEQLRVIITNDMIYFFAEGTQGPEIIYEDYLEEFLGNNKIGYTVTSASGRGFAISRAKNCGCGSTLRAFFPFPGVPFVSQIAR